MNKIEKYRQKIRSMDFIPLNDEELAELIEKDKKAVVNARLEGIYFTEDEEVFFKMLQEERVPPFISRQLFKEWVIENEEF